MRYDATQNPACRDGVVSHEGANDGAAVDCALLLMMMWGANVQHMLGREREISVLDDLIDYVNDRGAALVVRGEAGAGKSALLASAYARAQTRGMLGLNTTGVQSEALLPFAGLHQLLRPILSDVADLPGPQRDALKAAFGMTSSAAPDLFLIALAALELLASAAAHAPLLLVAEDAHWLDRSTCDVLAFVARRLESDPIILLIAIREGCENVFVNTGLPEMHLDGLDIVSAGVLLDEHTPGLPPSVRERLLDDAAGNPLALVELPAALDAEQLDGAAPLPPQLPLTTRLERAFYSRVAQLPAATRTLLLIAAVNDGGLLAEVLSAAAMIADVTSVAMDALEPAVDARLVEIDDLTLRFRHPLVRSAIYQAASVAKRHAAHAALATVLAGQPDRSIWHRAASRVGSDEEVASELEAAAQRAEVRGALAVSVVALERAAQLSVDSARRGDRLLRAADLAFGLGRHDLGKRLLHNVESLELGPQEQTRLSWLREIFADEGTWSGAARVRAFVEMADQARRDGDAALALRFLLMIALRCFWSNPGQEIRDLVITVAEQIPVPIDNPMLIAILAFSDPVARGASVLDRLSHLPPDGGGDPDMVHLLGTAATAVGSFDRALALLATSTTALRAQGQLGLLARVLVSQAWAAIHLGVWNVAMPASEEANRLARETRQPLWAAAAQAAEATLAAMRGEYSLSTSLADGAERILLAVAANPLLSLVQLARGRAALAGGRYAEAYAHLRRVLDPSDSAYHPYVRWWVIGDLVEAAAHSGHQEEARIVVKELEPLAEQTHSPILLAGLTYARPLLAGEEDAEALFLAGLAADITNYSHAHERLQLAYGSWLRRQRRVVESRAPLRAARDAFDARGVIPWGERARQELRASGVTSRRRTPGAWDQLSPQDLQIAQMAATGLSNREIGQRLYLSHRTIGFHLYRIFPKLGITSRAELRAVLDSSISSR